MKILVIGGTRYLGRAIVDKLAARGDEVTVANRGLTRGEQCVYCLGKNH